jgi:hypothetical protein
MRISEKKKTELYKSFSDPIMNLRIKLSSEDVTTGRLNGEAVDEKLFKLENEIWMSICKTLGIDKP